MKNHATFKAVTEAEFDAVLHSKNYIKKINDGAETDFFYERKRKKGDAHMAGCFGSIVYPKDGLDWGKVEFYLKVE